MSEPQTDQTQRKMDEAKTKADATIDQVSGKAKDTWGDVSGDNTTKAEGMFDQAKGKAKGTFADVKGKLGSDDPDQAGSS